MFGSFGVAVDGKAIYIQNDKARELFAILVEKRGSFLTIREAIALLWECEPDDRLKARYRKTVSRLMSDLRKFGIDYIVESVRGAKRILPEYIDSDYYKYLDGVMEPSGTLLPDYSWSEYIPLP